METQDQINQNPEAALPKQPQEEKPETVERTVDNQAQEIKPEKVVKATILKKEKAHIIDLIHSRVDSEEAKLPVEKKPKRKAKLIPKKLKEQILALVRDTKTAPVPRPKTISKKEKEKVEIPTAITETERRLILRLLRDVSKRVKASRTEKMAAEKIDYEHLNKQELVEMLEDIVDEKDVSIIKQKIAQIKVAFYHRNKEDIDNKLHDFIAGGGKEEAYHHVPDPLEQRFHQAFMIYKHNKAKFSEALEKDKQVNLTKKLDILEELKELINSEETLKKTYDEFKVLQDKWKEVGMVPAAELNNLWQNYHFLVEKFFDKVRINKELRDLDLKKNLEQKIELCKKAEELLLEDSVTKSFKLLQQYHDEWREIGPVPRENKDEVWERFKAATDQINVRRREHYKELHEEQLANYEAKEALCVQAEAFLSENESDSVKGWQKATDKMNELLKMWKSIGRAPKVHNDEIWKRFKSSLDQFYSAKRSFFSVLKEQQLENYNRKLDLCIRAEAIKLSEDWKATTNDLIQLQKEWKEIGPVPRKYSDKIWKRFRAACDEFFNRKSEFYKNSHDQEDENLKKKQQIIQDIKNFELKEDKNNNLEALKEFQKRWLEIGHVPFHDKDKVYKQYRDALDELMGKLGVSKTDLSAKGYQSKLDVFKNAPDWERRLSKERSAMANKLKKLKDDIILWENNIGFFSNSKQSTVLKAEFEKKIERAKKDFELLKQKIKMIDKEM